MLYDGREYRRNKHLGWRRAQDHAFIDEGKKDVYADGGFTTREGQEIPDNSIVVFRIKDADIVNTRFNGNEYKCYDQSTVPPEKCIPICAHTHTNVAIGVHKVKKGNMLDGTRFNLGRDRGDLIQAGQMYVEQSHYLVFDGVVYQWTARIAAKPEDLK